MGCLFADNYDYDDDKGNVNKACGFNIVLIAMTMAMNDDSIVIWWRDQFFFSIPVQINIWFSNFNFNLTWPWLGFRLTSPIIVVAAINLLKIDIILFEGWMSKAPILFARFKDSCCVYIQKWIVFIDMRNRIIPRHEQMTNIFEQNNRNKKIFYNRHFLGKMNFW